MRVKGFTLIEVIVAITILSVSVVVLFELLSRARERLKESRSFYKNFLILDRKIKLGDYEDLKVKRKPLEDYPFIYEESYNYNGVILKLYSGG